MSADGWVADGDYYGKLGDLVLKRADVVVWLDPPLPTILSRLARRTLRRMRGREDLWRGNRETWRQALFSRNSLFVWVLKSHRRRRRHYEERLGRFEIVRLRAPREVELWLASFDARQRA